ncbi:MAG: InlB B-repeat-containing protein [Treponemataceae bacterium]|nr:InlB B-repeat-containing protein [Treponemataceae bacterium]
MRKGLLLFALLFALLSALAGCENLGDTLTDDLTTTFTFYDNDDDETELVACPYRIGTVLPADSLPKKSLKRGYLVDGWRFFQKGTNAAYDVPTNVAKDDYGIVTSVTVTSVPLSFQVVWWKPISYTIIFDGNSGHLAGNESVSTQSEVYSYSETGGPALWKNEFVRNGYDFNGWNIAANRGKTQHDYGDGETLKEHLADEDGAVVTLYACWLAKEITITFDANGGSGTMDSATRKVGDSLPACGFAAPEEGKIFAGWQWTGHSFADNATLTESNYPNEDATFVAQWDWKTVAVTFDPNGGDGGSFTQECKWGQPQPLPKSNRHGYDFAGWNTKQDGTGTAYADSGSFTQDNTTLYAQWKLRFVAGEKSPEMGFNQSADCFVFTAPSGSAYQWTLRSGDGTVVLGATGSTCTISYAEYENNPADYTLVVTVFDASGVPTQTCWAKFRVDPPQSP